MRRFVENTDAISAKWIGMAIPQDVKTSKVELEITGIGIQEIMIISTARRDRGHQRWFLCPGCGTRIGKLYLPAGEMAFLCRRGHRLAYRAQLTREGRKKKKKSHTRQEKRVQLLDMLQRWVRKEVPSDPGVISSGMWS